MSGIEHYVIFMQVIQEEEAGLHTIVEENTFADNDSDGMPSSPAPYLVSVSTNHCMPTHITENKLESTLTIIYRIESSSQYYNV